ncbi:unnamed protein product, partial [Mesorhabditis belari]|uniref:Major facilitator superfamily (MFS) profile domain-containing protein n=1 Tax=Mesorhabditis belari TaxID=2138241 RepID=A0AAF3FII5_9BILA
MGVIQNMELDPIAEHPIPIDSPLWTLHARRFQIVLLIMIGFGGMVFMRANIAFGMVCMINSTALSQSSQTTQKPKLFSPNFTQEIPISGCSAKVGGDGSPVMDYGGEITWEPDMQNLLFSAAFWGALAGILPATPIVQHMPSHRLILGAILIISGCSLLFPFFAVYVGFWSTFISRFIMGFVESLVHPSIAALLSRWFPVEERSTAVALQNTGLIIGMILGPPLAGSLCASSLRWPAIFFVAGAFGLLWSIFWGFLSSHSPDQDTRMGKIEKEYLTQNQSNPQAQKKRVSVPYVAIFLSTPFWAINIVQFSLNLYATFIQVYLPLFYKEVLYLDVVMNGVFVAVPYVVNGVFNVGYSIFIDRLKKSGKITPTHAVKLSQFLANLGTGLAFVMIAWLADCSHANAILVILSFSSVFLAMFASGMFTSLLSIAPQYTATLCSMSLFPAMLGRLFCPYIVSVFRHAGTPEEWQRILLLIGAFSLGTGVLFAIFGTADIQPWALTDEGGKGFSFEAQNLKYAESRDLGRSQNIGRKDSRLPSGPVGFPSDLTTSVMSIDRAM